jgi:hypothetical protein
MSNYKVTFLLEAGNEILLKLVIQGILTYTVTPKSHIGKR